MESKWADELVNFGNIRINNLKSYSETDNLSIQDNGEGQFMLVWKPDKKGRILKSTPLGTVDVTDNPGELISDFTSSFFRERVMPDVFCISTSYSKNKNLFDDYDACVEIINPEAFLNLIVGEMRIKDAIEPFKMSDSETWGLSSDILYVDDRKGGIRYDEDIYFIKPKVPYKDEKEFRVIMKPVLNHYKDKAEYKDLIIPKLKYYCRRIY